MQYDPWAGSLRHPSASPRRLAFSHDLGRFWCIWGFSRVSRLYIHRRILVRTFANPGFSRDSASDNGWCSSVSVKKNDATSADANWIERELLRFDRGTDSV
jgi:hypothetical protein